MKTQKNEYREMLINNNYISFENVINFLREATISDILLVADIGKNGLSVMDYQDLQEAIDEAEIWESKKDEFYQLRKDDKDFAKQYDDTDEDFEEWFEKQGKL